MYFIFIYFKNKMGQLKLWNPQLAKIYNNNNKIVLQLLQLTITFVNNIYIEYK